MVKVFEFAMPVEAAMVWNGMEWYGCDAMDVMPDMDGVGVTPGLDVRQLPPAWSAWDTDAAW